MIDRLLSDTKLYNVFFVCSHGSLAENRVGGTFTPYPDTILLYTGAGKPGFPIVTNKRMEKNWMNLFDTDTIKQTFAACVGLYEDHTDLLYKVPNDSTASPELLLSIHDEDRAEDVGFWGVFKHTGSGHGKGHGKGHGNRRREFSNIEEIPELTKELYGGTFASVMMDKIHTKYANQGKTNIILFISCRMASKAGTRIANYSDSASIFYTPSHFMLRYKPSGLDRHIPPENPKRKRIYLQYHDQRIPLDPNEQNQTVVELLQYLRKNYGLFDYDGVKSITIIHRDQGLVLPLIPDVLFVSQWEESYLTKEGADDNILVILPAFTEPRTNAPFHSTEFYDPEHLETSVVFQKTKHASKTRSRPRRVMSKIGTGTRTRTRTRTRNNRNNQNKNRDHT